MHSATQRNNGDLFIDQVALSTIAKQFGTPCYVYSKKAIEQNFIAYKNALSDQPNLICYAVKSNSNIAVLQTLAALGAGFDIVSVGELERVLLAGGNPANVVFSGLAKSSFEMRRALQVGIHCFNVESESELALLNETAAELSLQAPVSMRVNPDVDANTHPYISTGLKEDKFGIAFDTAIDVYKQASQMSNINLIGIDCHIGSQLTEIQPFVDATERLLVMVDQLSELGIQLNHIDIGGGLGVRYHDEQVLTVDALMKELLPLFSERSELLVLEPGRSMTANAGILLTQVQYLKSNDHKNFAVVDAAMNDLIRPALYQAEHEIWNISEKMAKPRNYNIVGPICESSDFLAKDIFINADEDDVLAVRTAGAYGFVMASNYNSRPRACEVLVDGDKSTLIRKRETLEDILKMEMLNND